MVGIGSLQLGILDLSLLENGDVGIGVFQEVRKARVAFATAAAPPYAPTLAH